MHVVVQLRSPAENVRHARPLLVQLNLDGGYSSFALGERFTNRVALRAELGDLSENLFQLKLAGSNVFGAVLDAGFERFAARGVGQYLLGKLLNPPGLHISPLLKRGYLG